MKKRVSRLLDCIKDNALIAYAAIALLQVKVMLEIWEYRDLMPGDTSSYYKEVFTWIDEAKVDIVWSPLYTLCLAILHFFLKDPFWVLTIAQIGIALCASILVLTLLRRLIPKHIAWIIAVWWTLLPINFDTVYSVHLFSALFPLALFVMAAYANNIYGRGIVLGGFLLTAVLVRNEYSALFFLCLLTVAAYEIHVFQNNRTSFSARKCLCAYGLPLLITILISGVFYAMSISDYDEMQEALESKHTLNVCQIYAYNRIQQGDSWSGNPWTECQSLIERDFKRSEISFSQAFFLNPEAMLDHVLWNFRLIPSGTQLALFNAYAGGSNPDYMSAKKTSYVWLPFVLVLALSAFAAVRYLILPVLRRQSVENGFAWLLMSGAALLVFGIMVMQRPRPSYMFPYTLFIMALAGLGLHAFLETARLSRTVRTWWPLAGILLIPFVPTRYDADYINHFGYKGQEWRHIYERIVPHFNRSTIKEPAVVLIPAGNYTSLCNYLGVECHTLKGEGGPFAGEMDRTAVQNGFAGKKVYLLYHQDMIWELASTLERNASGSSDYVAIQCFSLKDNKMTCHDGEIDLSRGFMSDGTTIIPLHAVLFINDGHVIDRIDYDSEEGYYLQILMKGGRIETILVADEQLFQTEFNQQYLIGNFDRRFFEEVYSDFPDFRVLVIKEKVVSGDVDQGRTHTVTPRRRSSI